jgi:hypothetical protein
MRKVMLSVISVAGVASAALADSGCLGVLPGPVPEAARLSAVVPAGPSPTWVTGGLLPAHQAALAFLKSAPAASGPRSLCFAPDSDPEVVAAFTAVLDAHNARANPIEHWTSTATNPGGGHQEGEPITLTYSFVPDGTFVPNIDGFQGNSNLRAYLDGIYGSQAAWQPVFDEVFSRWSEVSGITYVYEPNDDGVTLNQNAGVLGVRGDLRIAGIFLDGPSNVLAYNNFPNDGDMVIDTGDTYFASIGGNSVRLRNVAAHEHGHGMGLAHVCPIEQEKLMEPFVTTVFDGPQHDDIRGAQRLYGDPFEPDNTPAAAMDLGIITDGTTVQGAVPAPGVSFGSIRSIDAAGEQDWIKFTAPSPARVGLVLNPIGRSYDSSQQACGGTPGSCCSGNFINSRTISDLHLTLFAADATTVIADADNGAAGSVEGVSGAVLASAGTYYVRVTGTGGLDAQLYTLSITTELFTSTPLEISLPNGAPDAVMPGEPTSFDVMIVPNEETIVPGAAVLRYRFGGGSFLSAALTPQGGDLYTATLPPAACDDQVQFYVSVEGSENGVQTTPASGAAAPFEAEVGTPVDVAAFDFQTAPGWTVSNVPSGVGTFAGSWNRGVPVNDGRGDPNADFDGSGQCWMTANAAGNSDVDGGETILLSPIFDVSGMRDLQLSYARWYSNTFGASPEQDTMVVEVSDDGGANWLTLEVVGPMRTSWNGQVAGGWFERSFALDGLIDSTSSLRVRFRASDAEPGSVVEAGIDAFELRGRICEDAPPCPCERAGDPAQVDVFDLLGYLDLWFAADAAAELDGTAGVDVFDLLAFLDCWFPASAGGC